MAGSNNRDPFHRRDGRRLVDLDRRMPTVQQGNRLEEQWAYEMDHATFQGEAFDDGLKPLGDSDFADIHPELLLNMRTNMFFEKLGPLQRHTLPVLLNEKCYNLLVRAPTGSGKTAAFLLPAIQLVINQHKEGSNVNAPIVLILSNTGTLSTQTYTHACQFSGYKKTNGVSNTGCSVFALFKDGDNAYHGVKSDIVVATAGGVLRELAKPRSKLDLSQLQLFVLDEADKMMDRRAFGDEIKEIFEAIPEETRARLRVALFSATYVTYEDGGIEQNEVMELLFSRNGNPTVIAIESTKGFITQRVVKIDDPVTLRPEQMETFVKPFYQKLNWLKALINKDLKDQGITKEGPFTKKIVIFVERRLTCNYLAGYLLYLGYKFLPMNSDYTNSAKQEVFTKLDKGEIQGVIATNQMARGQDIPDVAHVIIFEMAKDFSDYKHRIGRTGRIGHGGMSTALVLFNGDQQHLVELYNFMVEHGQTHPRWLRDAAEALEERTGPQEFLSPPSEDYGDSDEEDLSGLKVVMD